MKNIQCMYVCVCVWRGVGEKDMGLCMCICGGSAEHLASAKPGTNKN